MHSSRFRKSVALLAAAAVLLTVAVPGTARADGAADAASAGVGVARISLIQGAVAVQRGDSATPLAAAINAPVLGADYVTTGDGARAEIQFDGSSSVRLGADVQMRFTHLDTSDRELQLAAGTVELRLLRGTDGRSQIDTPSISIRPRTSGGYRVSVDSAGRTQVTVRAGSADIVTPQGTQTLAVGSTLLAQGASANPSIQSTDALAYDDFDRFNRERDDREERALASAAYAAPGVAGIDDLDAYGRWITDGGYGRVWVPYNVASTWAPYRDGRWMWEEGFGWTWLGYEPWGWAPYHYGRWYRSTAYGWCWYPERSFVVWRPAVVAFLSFGNVGFGFGDIGWVPLAPYEPYYAWWGNGYGNHVTYVTNNYYYGNVNNGNVTVVNNGDAHNGQRGFGNMRWATSVSHDRFAKGDFAHMRSVDQSKLRAVRPLRGVVPVVPSDANLRFSNRPAATSLAVGAALIGGTFAGNTIAVRRTPFVQQQADLAAAVRVRPATEVKPVSVQPQPAVEQSARRIPVTNGTTTTMMPTNTNVNANAARTVSDPWSRFGASRGTPVTHTAASASASASAVVQRSAPQPPDDAWRHFDTTHPAAAREATGARNATTPHDAAAVRDAQPMTHPVDTPRRANVTEGPRSYDAPRRATADQRPVQQAAPQPAAVQQQRSAPPPAARTERAPATKSTTPH